MAYSFSETEVLVVRMTADDRQTINRLILHKRQEFEAVMKKGIVAMLNAQEEHDKLAEKRAEYLSFLSAKTERKKIELSHLTSMAQSASQSAPLGIGAGAQVVLGAANVAGQALLDDGEQRRQAEEAEQNLYSAQMLYYIPPQEYEPIAERVASILSYRYQFLIFRLAPGENGYIKLANFFLKSMKNYAISRLREQKNNVISALINAAIPPSTDAFSYRDFPSIDLANFRVHLEHWGERKTLALDEEANEIVRRCGPAVRTLVGGSEFYVDPGAVKLKNYHDYTIIGALNHAPILNAEGQVIAGLQTSHRQGISLDGNMKYPMILLSSNETTAHLGVNFATRSTDFSLEPVHLEALKRLVPNFATNRAVYQLTEAYDQRLQHFDGCRYPEERLECPWTARREQQLQRRLVDIYSSAKAATVVSEIQEIEGRSKLQEMLRVGHIHALTTQVQELDIGRDQLLEALRLLFIHDLPDSTQKRNQIQALNRSKYAALSVSQMLIFMLRANTFDLGDFIKAKRLLELVNQGIYSCRSNLIQETARYDQALRAKSSAETALAPIVKAHQLAFGHYQLLIELLQDSIQDEVKTDLFQRDLKMKHRMMKNLTNQIRDNIASLRKMKDVGEMIAVYDVDYAAAPVELEDAIRAFDKAALDLREAHQSSFVGVGSKMTAFFEQLIFEANFYHQELKLAVTFEACEFIDNPIWQDGLALGSKTLAEKRILISEAIDTWVQELQDLAHAAQSQISRFSAWSSSRAQIEAELERLKQEALIRRNKLVATFHAVSYVSDSFNSKIAAYLLRAKQQDELSVLYFLGCESGINIQTLSTSAKRLYLSYQQNCAKQAKIVADDMIQQHERISRDISWQELKEKSLIVRGAKEQLELEVRDDIELIELMHNQLHVIDREAFQLAQDLTDIDSKLNYFREHFEYSENQTLADETFLEMINQKVDDILAHLGSQLIDVSSFNEYIIREKSIFNEAWHENVTKQTQEFGFLFLSKLIKWVNEHYRSLYPLQSRLEIIKHAKESVSLIINQEPLELVITRKQALRSVRQAYRYIQMINQRIQQHDLGLMMMPTLKKRDLFRDVLLWSASLSMTEREWLDCKNFMRVRKTLLQMQEYKSPIRMAYSLLLAMISEQIGQKRTDIIRLRKIQNQLLKMRLGAAALEAQAPQSLISEQTTLLDSKRKLIRVCGQKILNFDTALEQLLMLKNLMVARSVRLFFMEWKRKALDLPSEEIVLKAKSHALVAEVKIGKELVVGASGDEEEALEFSMEDIEELYLNLQQSFVIGSCDERLSPRRTSQFSIFPSPSSSEESLDHKLKPKTPTRLSPTEMSF